MRLFTAIGLPDDLKRRLVRAARPRIEQHWRHHVRETPVSFTAEQNLHVTLKFLGEVQDGDVTGIVDSLGEILPRGPLGLAIGGLELFPPRGPVRVLAAALVGDTGRLGHLFAAIDEACAGFGVKQERRPYRPHVTLARARYGLPADHRPVAEDAASAVLHNASWVADCFALIRSELKPAGPIYTPVVRFAL